MNPVLKQVKNIHQEGCVSIILKTHRTHPDNASDAIELKNLVKEASDRLLADYDKRSAAPTIERINEIVDGIDHQHNLESLVIFANSDFADFTRLPLEVESRVVIDDTFATRDLVRAMHETSAYYILVLSRDQARLLEVYNEQLVQEHKGNFPQKNKLYTTDKLKRSTAKGQDNLIEEFFNQVDKALQEAMQAHPLPVLLATESRNYDHYLKVADKKDLILGFINRNGDDEPPHAIIKDGWPAVLELVKTKNATRIEELKTAIGQGNFESDYNEIWRAIQEGRGKTLFVKAGFFQPALLADNEILLVDKTEKDQKGIVDDILDEMIEHTMAFGGDVVFMDGGETIEKMQNIALVTRY